MPDDLAHHLRANRLRRGMTQAKLAEAAGLSLELISKIERRERLSPHLTSLMALASALDMSVGELLGAHRGLTTQAQDSEVTRLRQAVLAVTPVDVEPPTVDVLQSRLARLWMLYFDGRYAEVARELPPMIEQARAAVRQYANGQDAAANAALAESLQLAADLLTHLGYDDLGHAAVFSAMDAAGRAADDLLMATLQASRVWIMTRQGLCDDAAHLAATTAREIEPRLSEATVERVAVWGELLRYGHLALARGGRLTEAADMLGLMRAAAERMGTDMPQRYSVVRFGPTMASMRAVDHAISLDDPREAVRLAQRIEHPERVPPMIHSRFLLNVAWAQMHAGTNRDAVLTLLRAESVSPQAIRYQTIAHATVAELLPQRRKQRMPGLTALAQRLGVPVD